MQRRRNDRETFERLTFGEQEQAIRDNTLQFRELLGMHLSRAEAECRLIQAVLNSQLELLKDIIQDYSAY